MSEANVDLVRRNYEVINSIGRTGSEFLDPEEMAPDLWARLANGMPPGNSRARKRRASKLSR